ncbi:hypothetical protein BDN72DRAFT_905297 [Pluteus cervinus]|uniref:Uncharacterized protein n=1 Tax=Pluteus cervinus TaxID=181527 RepID=A0ACD3A2Z0_9AGAR|nr:hypothetical protein BDN72DRAFT_905297 [Pluteus cervinus]
MASNHADNLTPRALTNVARLGMGQDHLITISHLQRLCGFTLTPLHTGQSPPTSLPFTLNIPSKTDLWSKPPSTHSANQPTFYHSLPLAKFAGAKVVVKFEPNVLYDQAGIAVLFPKRDSGSSVEGSRRWIKAGAEYEPTLGGLKKSVVVTRDWSDWSVADFRLQSPGGGGGIGVQRVEVSVERIKANEGGWGPSLLVKVNEEVIREVTWAYAQEEDGIEEVWVGVYGARPTEAEGDLKIEVEAFSVEVLE